MAEASGRGRGRLPYGGAEGDEGLAEVQLWRLVGGHGRGERRKQQHGKRVKGSGKDGGKDVPAYYAQNFTKNCGHFCPQ